MNESASAHEFVTTLLNNEWEFYQIYVDHYCMHGPYVAHSFSQFFRQFETYSKKGYSSLKCTNF